MEPLEKIRNFGRELSNKIKEGSTIQEISAWVDPQFPDFCFLHSKDELDTEIYDLIVDLMTMAEGKEYEMSRDELQIQANYLIFYQVEEINKVNTGWHLQHLLNEKTSIEDISYWAYSEQHNDISDANLEKVLTDIALLTESEWRVYTRYELTSLARLLMLNVEDPYKEWHKTVTEAWLL